MAAGGRCEARFVFVQTLWTMVPEARARLEALAEDPRDTSFAVKAWADNLRLSVDWVIEGASMLVEAWREHPESRGVIWMWNVPPGTAWDGPAPRPWDPLAETESDYDAYLRRYVSSVRALAEGKGLRRTPVKRTPEHFRWLIDHQVNGMTYAQIAQRYGSASGLADASVGQALSDTAALIGLPLRPAPKR